jgi:hypothetical protein
LHGVAIMQDVLERTGGGMRYGPECSIARSADIGLIMEIEPSDDHGDG